MLVFPLRFHDCAQGKKSKAKPHPHQNALRRGTMCTPFSRDKAHEGARPTDSDSTPLRFSFLNSCAPQQALLINGHTGAQPCGRRATRRARAAKRGRAWSRKGGWGLSPGLGRRAPSGRFQDLGARRAGARLARWRASFGSERPSLKGGLLAIVGIVARRLASRDGQGSARRWRCQEGGH